MRHHPNDHRKFALSRVRGFTLVEMLVATALLMMLLVVISSLANSTILVTSISGKRISAEGESRQVLNRISSDVSRGLFDQSLPWELTKAVGNDTFGFHLQADGYHGDRGVSRVRYRIGDEGFERGVHGTSWVANGGEDQLEFRTNAFKPVSEYEVFGKGVFRFELGFLMSDGSIKAEAQQAQLSDGDVLAIIVSIAALDNTSRQLLTAEDMVTLAALFPDAEDDKNMLSSWGEVINSSAYQQSAIPKPARAAVRIFKRTFYLH